VLDMTEPSNEQGLINAKPVQASPELQPVMLQEAPKSTRKRMLLVGVVGVAVLAALVVFGIPWVENMLNTVSTDDAYVNGHVTFVAPRVGGQISRVLVDDNNRVHKGDLLAELDKEPYQVAVSEKQAAVDTAKADLQAATAAARGIEAQAMSQRWDLQHAVEGVDGEVALLHARVAAIAKSKAALVLAQIEFDRARQLVPRGDTPQEVLDQRQAELTTSGAELAQTLAEVYQIRVSLGLPAQPGGSGDLGQVPPDLDETFSSVLQAQAQLIQSAAQLGVAHSISSTNWATSTPPSPNSRPTLRRSSWRRRNSKPPGAISRRPN
jgi:membrane fusion protein (multidrug efflux system)